MQQIPSVLKAQAAQAKLNATPANSSGAAGDIVGTISEVSAAVGAGLAAGQGATFMDQLAAVARKQAVAATNVATATPGSDAGKIALAQQEVAEGDTLRTASSYEDAANKYKDALANAESAVP